MSKFSSMVDVVYVKHAGKSRGFWLRKFHLIKYLWNFRVWCFYEEFFLGHLSRLLLYLRIR